MFWLTLLLSLTCHPLITSGSSLTSSFSVYTCEPDVREDTFWRDQSIRFTSSVSPCRAIPTLIGPPPGDPRQVTGGKKHSFFVNHQRRLFPHEVNSRGNHNTQRGCQNVPILSLDFAVSGLKITFRVFLLCSGPLLFAQNRGRRQ